MKLPDQQLQKFIELYRTKYGVVLDRQEALDKALRLLKLVELVESNTYKEDNGL